MIGWIWSFVIGQFCKHCWETVREGPVVNDSGKTTKWFYDKECKKCGLMKTWRL